MTTIDKIKEDVQKYYGQMLSNSKDLKTNACCPIDAMPKNLLPYLRNVHEEVVSKFYGCGSPIPPLLEDKIVLDLGCGTGRDCYILSQIVGSNGRIIGIDMTDEQLSVANKHMGYHMDKFGYEEPNVLFKKGFIEDLSFLDNESVDVVISNCVINLSSNKEAVFKEAFRVLKTGGELYFSDVFADRRIPQELKEDKVMLGECLGGALYKEDFRRIMQSVNCHDFRVVSKSPIKIDDAEIIEKAGNINFSSITIRAFKCDFEDICENYGQVAFYKGTIKDMPHSFVLDDHHEFKTGLPYPICGNTFKMLGETRYAEHFELIGDFSVHYGFFDCSEEKVSGVSMPCC
ncbi:MAG: methyltransferase type 11 [Alphaproteobacteria bacterium CG11_big_fil_rev_8_21_14_0_20_39_49]|nr:MAG: methyltransferase type 11 [Alphaproteobacteria bacterium CG11_big_fil_rev_8_21_14_0_20_39_49]